MRARDNKRRIRAIVVKVASTTVDCRTTYRNIVKVLHKVDELIGDVRR